MAGCGQCPDTCSCVIVDENGIQYDGAGVPLDPIVIPRSQNTKWQGVSSDGSITITEGDVVPANDDGHAPDLAVNFCNLIEEPELEAGDLLVIQDEDGNCRPHKLRDPLPGEFLGLDPSTLRAGWVQGAVIAGGEVPLGVPLEFWGNEASIPAGYVLCAGQLAPISTFPQLFAVIGHNGNGGVDPGGGNFRIPDKRGVVTVGRDNMGGTSANRLTSASADVIGVPFGLETAVLAVANLPSHGHGVTDPGHGHGVSDPTHAHGVSDPGHAHTVQGHTHGVGPTGRSFVTVDTLTPTQVAIANDAPDDIIITVGPGLAQTNNQATGITGGATNGAGTGIGIFGAATGVSILGAGTGISIQNTGSGTGHANVQPTVAANFIMRAM